MADDSVFKPDDRSLSPSVPPSTRRGRRGRRPDGLLEEHSLSPKPTPNGSQRYVQQSAFHTPKTTPTTNTRYVQQSGFNSSVMSIDWGANESPGNTSKKYRKYDNFNGSLTFDDELSLSLDQACIDDDEN